MMFSEYRGFTYLLLFTSSKVNKTLIPPTRESLDDFRCTSCNMWSINVDRVSLLSKKISGVLKVQNLKFYIFIPQEQYE